MPEMNSPVDPDLIVITDKFKNPVKIDDNPALISGAALTAAERFSQRTGHFKSIYMQGGICTDSGRWIVDSEQAAPFVSWRKSRESAHTSSPYPTHRRRNDSPTTIPALLPWAHLLLPPLLEFLIIIAVM